MDEEQFPVEGEPEPAPKSSIDTEIVKCPQCGADMLFDPEKSALVCPYCGSVADIENQQYTGGIDFDNFDENTLKKDEGSVTYRCPNCHAETILHEFGAAEQCPFCGATNIVSIDALPGLKPDCILPFILTKELAVASSLKWIKKKWFAPSGLKKAFTVKDMRPVYEPSFVFSADTFSRYDGRFGETYTVTVGSGKNRHTETRTRWYNVSGTYDRYFSDIVIEASAHLDQKQMDKLGPYDTGNAVNYKAEYVAGYLAERHNVGVRDSYVVAKKKMEDAIRDDIISKYNPDKIEYLHVYTKHSNTIFKHLLLPVYSCSYKFKEKLYNYFVNGRTGRTTGKSPLSPIRVGIAVIVGLAAIAGLAYLFLTN